VKPKQASPIIEINENTALFAIIGCFWEVNRSQTGARSIQDTQQPQTNPFTNRFRLASFVNNG